MTSRGLLVAVDETKFGRGYFGPLPGAVADVNMVQKAATAREIDCNVIRGSRATAALVKDELVRLAEQSQDGDILFFYFSGHGWRYPDCTGEEVDRFDEALVCSDRPIEDDWFGVRFWPRIETSCACIMIVDACHSETAVLNFAPRQEPAPAVMCRIASQRPWRLLLSACRDIEEAQEIGNADSGGGVVTTTMLEVMSAKPGVSHEELWMTTAREVRNRYRHIGAGTPRITSTGPDDSLLLSSALQWSRP